MKQFIFSFLGLFIAINVYFALQIDSKVEEDPVSEKTFSRRISSTQKAKVAPLVSQTSTKKNLEAEYSDQEIINWAIDNKACMILKNMDLLKSRLGINILKHSYFEVGTIPEGEEYLREVLDSKLFQGETIPRPNSFQAEFLNALLLGGFLQGNGISPLRYDYSQALSLLENLEKRQSDNALVTLFRASLLKKMNAKESDIREAIIQALYKKQIDSPFFQLRQALFEKGLSNSSFYLLSQLFINQIPHLNMTPIHSSLLEFSKGLKGIDANLHHELLSLGQRFMRSYTQSQRHLFLKAWTESAYSFGTKIFLSSWKALYPEFNEPFYEQQSFQKMAKSPYTIPVAEYEKLLLQTDCPILELEDRLELERQAYLNSPAY